MLTLKSTLLKIKKISEKDFKYCCALLRKEYLYQEVEDNDSYFYDIDDLEEAFNGNIIKVKGINVIYKGKEKKIFPHVTCGWDGDSTVFSIEFNLKSLASNDFSDGPASDIVMLKNDKYPGLALHYNQYKTELHIFM